MYVKYEKLRTHVLHKCPSKVPRRRLLGVCRICEGQGMVFLVYDYEESVS